MLAIGPMQNNCLYYDKLEGPKTWIVKQNGAEILRTQTEKEDRFFYLPSSMAKGAGGIS